MGSKQEKITALIVIFMFTSSLIYFEATLPDVNKEMDLNQEEDNDLIIIDEHTNNDEFEDDSDLDKPLSHSLIEGDYASFAFFSGGGTEQGLELIADPEGEEQIYWGDSRNNVIVWETYDDIKDDAYLAKELYWRALSTSPQTWPTQPNVWFHMHDHNYPNEPSKMFSPVFSEDWYVSGRVHYLTYLETSTFSESITIGVRLSIHLFNPADQSTSLITSKTFTVPITYSVIQRTFSSDIAIPVLIPAGYQLKYDIELRFSSIPSTGSVLMFTGYPVGGGGSMTWDIVDGIYSNSYTLLNRTRMAGIQMYMRKDVYPDISVFGAINETVYQEATDITIDVTPTSTSFFRWDGNPTWTSFDSQKITSLPPIHGWHTLDINASDPIFNNTRTAMYIFGYDESTVNVVLENAFNDSLVASSYDFQFSVYNISSATYEWDNDGNIQPFSTPYNITVSNFEGSHNLTILTMDFYTTEPYFYNFSFEAYPPSILLKSPINDTLQAPGKGINIEINDSSGVDVVLYKWDADTDSIWNPISGITYRTYLPAAGGWHYLYITANDTFGNQDTQMYRFFTDPTILNVELRTMLNESYFIGGNAVELTVTSSNDTIKYQWDGGTVFDKSDAYWDGTFLVLNGSYALPSTLGVHLLTILTGDLSNDGHTFVFVFTIDQQAPEFNSEVYAYSNQRYLRSAILSFIVSDNFTVSSGIEMVISIDGGLNQTLVHPFILYLISFFDGNHSIVIYVRDTAGNYNVTTIYVIVDNTAPDIDYLIPEIVYSTPYDGFSYVPSDARVDVTITDDDTIIYSYYSMNSSAYVIFTDNFTVIGFQEGYYSINIKSNDTLGNLNVITIYLIIDNTAPDLALSFPFNFTSEINEITPLQFYTHDISWKTISSVKYEWDINPGFYAPANPDEFGYFTFSLTSGLISISRAFNLNYTILTIELEDIVGNIRIVQYNFSLDYTSPEDSFLIFNEENQVYDHVSDAEYVKGDTKIVYNETANTDLIRLEYYWDGNDEYITTLLSGVDTYPWNISVPSEDGLHNLTVKLYDDAGESLYSNIRQVIYFLIVDDITIDFITPNDFGDNYHATIIYKESFVLVFNVTDSFDGEALSNVNITWDEDPLYNLTIQDPIQLDNITYQITIVVYDVTNDDEADLVFYVGQFVDNYESFTLHLNLLRREGNLQVLSSSSESVYYGDIVSVDIQLQDDLNASDLVIQYLEVNNTAVSFDFNLTTMKATFYFSTSFFVDRSGNFTIKIYVESQYYHDTLLELAIFSIEIKPLIVELTLSVSSLTIIENTQLSIEGILTFLNGTPVSGQPVTIYIYIYYKDGIQGVYAAPPSGYEDYDDFERKFPVSNSQGEISASFDMTEDIAFVIIEGVYDGDDYFDITSFILEDIIITIPPPGLPSWLLYTIIGGSILIAGIISFIVFKVTRPKPFEELMKKITDEEIVLNYSILSPGIMLSIFDQRKGPIPLVTDHSLSVGRYLGRMQIGIENFLLKIADQAYSSLGFEEHTDERRVGSIVLPSEKMVGFLQGVQLKNPQARGGFENLSLIVLADREYGNLLLNYQEYLYPKIDELEVALKGKDSLKKVEELMKEIRKISVIIILAAQKAEKAQENGNIS